MANRYSRHLKLKGALIQFSAPPIPNALAGSIRPAEGTARGGNPSLALMMRTRHGRKAASRRTTSLPRTGAGFLQRKCACGSSHRVSQDCVTAAETACFCAAAVVCVGEVEHRLSCTMCRPVNRWMRQRSGQDFSEPLAHVLWRPSEQRRRLECPLSHHDS
jgi:hypothetical protein